MGTHPIFESDFDCLTAGLKMSAAIAESAWVNRAQYEGAWEAYQVYKATGQTVQQQKESNLDMDRVAKLETENADLKKQLKDVLARLSKIEGQLAGGDAAPAAAKEEEKGKVIAKSNIILDIKPWDDETPLDKLEECVRSVTMDGLLWGTGKFVAVGYGIKKLQITCVVEDDKVSTDDLEDQITGFDDYVQSMDIVAFNKI